MIRLFKHRCKHKFKDFPWYIDYNKKKRFSFDYLGIETLYKEKIIEPYVCLLCKKRLNKILACSEWVHFSKSEDIEDDWKRKFEGKILPRAAVEDMVNDCQLVDKSFLESYEYSQKITEDIMESIHKDKRASNCSDNNELMTLVNEVKNNLQVTQKGN